MNKFPHLIPVDYGCFQIIRTSDYGDIGGCKGLTNVNMFVVSPFRTDDMKKDSYNYRILFRSFVINQNKRNMIVFSSEPITIKEFYILDYAQEVEGYNNLDEITTNISDFNKGFENSVINQCKLAVNNEEVEKIVKECAFDLFLKTTSKCNLNKVNTGNYFRFRVHVH